MKVWPVFFMAASSLEVFSSDAACCVAGCRASRPPTANMTKTPLTIRKQDLLFLVFPPKYVDLTRGCHWVACGGMRWHAFASRGGGRVLCKSTAKACRITEGLMLSRCLSAGQRLPKRPAKACHPCHPVESLKDSCFRGACPQVSAFL